jgi:hypothetical protein
MAFRHVPLVQLLHQAVMGWIHHLSTCYQVHMGSYGHIPSCQAPKATTSRGPGADNAYLLLKAPRRV